MMKSQFIISIAYSISITFLFSLATGVAVAGGGGSTDNDVHKAFLECLSGHSKPNHPISSIIYTKTNFSYSSILQSYIRNLRFNESYTPKPDLIITVLHISHVQSAILCGKLHGLQMKIRSGGHDYEGVSYVSNVPFFILDMFNYRAINVSIEDQTAWIQVGATLGELYYRIAEKSNVHGFPAGVCPTVGVGGHFSGGGYGNMIRKYGLSIDNIIDAKMVDVSGRILDRSTMGEDLFWAITGGGGSSFGVVLSYKIKLVSVPPKVTVFFVKKTSNKNDDGENDNARIIDLVDKWQHIAYNLDKDIFIRMTLDVVTNNSTSNNNRVSFQAMFLGNKERLLTLMNKSFPELGLRQKDCLEMKWIESVLFWTGFPTGTPIETLLSRIPQLSTHSKMKSDYLKKPMTRDGIDNLLKKMLEVKTPVMQFNPYGGKMGEIPANAKPFPHRSGNIAKIQYVTDWDENGDEAAKKYVNLTRKLYEYMTPFVSNSPREAFLNYRDFDLGITRNYYGPNSYGEGLVYGVKYFMNNFNRLVVIKTKVDPDNYFRNEQSIPTLP